MKAFGRMLFSRSLPFRRRNVLSTDAAEVVLDLSRLLSRAYRMTPTGIDRVEFVYARELLSRIPERVSFAAVHPAGGYYGRVDTGAVRQFLSFTDARWRNRELISLEQVRSAARWHLLALRPKPVPVQARPRVYLQVSPHHLDNKPLVRAILAKENARLVTLVHDMIPLTHPEYTRPNSHIEHGRRIDTIDALALGILGNSQATVDGLTPFLTSGKPDRITRVAHLGVDRDDFAAVSRSVSVKRRPYFVCIGTIEARKNHLLLLNVWRKLVEEMGSAAPQLVLVGRRGWENENAVDMIERCEALRGHVIEHSDMADDEMRALLSHARALLLPSFIEGYGMPIAEALEAGVPVLCSDIAAHREVARDVAEYFDPIDGLGWVEAVKAYIQSPSARRDAQLGRLSGWKATSWSEHIDIALEVVDGVARIPASDPPAAR